MNTLIGSLAVLVLLAVLLTLLSQWYMKYRQHKKMMQEDKTVFTLTEKILHEIGRRHAVWDTLHKQVLYPNTQELRDQGADQVMWYLQESPVFTGNIERIEKKLLAKYCAGYAFELQQITDRQEKKRQRQTPQTTRRQAVLPRKPQEDDVQEWELEPELQYDEEDYRVG